MDARRLFLKVLAGFVGAAVAAVVLYLGFVDSLPPEAMVEKVLPDDRFPR